MSSNSAPLPADATEALERLGKLALHEQSMQKLLQAVTDLAKLVMPGDIEASVSLLVDEKPSTAVFTGQLALDLDERQYERGYGPCLHAATTGELTEIADTEAETRWADYMRLAAERGCRSHLSLPLVVGDRVAAALNMYARVPNAFDEQSRAIAQRFAPYAAVALASMHAYQDARDMANNLEIALQSRAVIDQAKGILMERYKLTADQAFQMLAQASMRANTKLRTIAESLVETGEIHLR
jgi:GAF domain-containing protein